MRPPNGLIFILLSVVLLGAMLFTLWAMERGKLKTRHGAYGEAAVPKALLYRA
jgi:hypothetical protein